ncbi:hypothetical protein IJG44_06800 [bacterium]|nr:hypothetical protein [bacterium]
MKKIFIILSLIVSIFAFVSCGDEGKTIYHGDTEHEDDSDVADTGTQDSDVSDSETPDNDSSDSDVPGGDKPDTGDDSDTMDDTDTTDDTDFEPVDPACQPIVFDKIASTHEDGIYAYVVDPEDPENALFWLDIIFYEYDPEYNELVYRTDLSPLKGKMIILGEGANANYATATEQVILYKNIYDEEGYMTTKYYFAKSGAIKIEDVIAGTNYSKGKGAFSLYEVTLDEENNETSTYVENGECFAVSDFAWDNVFANPPECMEDSDCSEGKLCDEGICEFPEDFYECIEDEDCGGFGVCLDNSCAEYR